MKLFLASEVKNEQTFQKLTEYVGGFKNKTIAYIPTAANGDGWGSWKDRDSWKLAQSLDAAINLVQLEDFRNDSVIAHLEGKDIIWFAGGQTGYLMYWIRRTQLDIRLKSILDSNTLYVGSSAGAMIAGKTIQSSEWFFTDEEHGAGIFPGIGLVDFDIYPHFQEEYYNQIKEKYKGNKLYLLKNGEEIIVEDGKIKLIGTERIISNQF